MNTIAKASIRNNDRNIGIDVGKSFLGIHILELDRHLQVTNTHDGIRELLKTLRRFKLTRIVVEATGGYERNLVEAFAESDMPVVVVQPTNVRQFAKAQGILAKTDKIDARLIAQFGAMIQPEIRPISSKKVRHVRDLLARKRQLVEARTQELNRCQKATPALQRSHTRSIKFLEKEIDWVNTQLEKNVHEVTEWQQTYENVRLPKTDEVANHDL